jgi:hypothetical protein
LILFGAAMTGTDLERGNPLPHLCLGLRQGRSVTRSQLSSNFLAPEALSFNLKNGFEGFVSRLRDLPKSLFRCAQRLGYQAANSTPS